MQESSLHKALKDYYTLPGDRQEVEVDGFLIDVVHENLLLEIQTSNFAALKSKLKNLLDANPMRLIHPIPLEKWIIKLPKNGDTPISHRKSPRHGRIEDMFAQLVYITQFLNHPNLSLEIVLTKQEEVRRDDGLGSWRRKGVSIVDHRLIEVTSKHSFLSKMDYLKTLPNTLPDQFARRELASALKLPQRLAGKMIYTLRELGLLMVTGKRSRTWLYSIVEL